MKTLKQTIRLLAVAAIGFGLLAILFTQLNVVVKAAPADQLDVCATCTYTTIQTAVNAASPGDTIRVAQGTYQDIVTSPGLLTSTVIITKDLTLIGGYSPDFQAHDPSLYETIVDGQNIAKGFYVSGSYAHIEGFTIINGYTQGVLVRESAVNGAPAGSTLVNNYVHDNMSGIVIFSAEATIENNRIMHNSDAGIVGWDVTIDILSNTVSHNNGGAILISRFESGSIASIQGNQILDNYSESVAGIKLEYGAQFTVTNNLIQNNQTQDDSGGGIAVFSRATGLIAYNDIISNSANYGGGIGSYDNGDLTISNNTINSNSTPNGGGGIHINPDDYNFSRTSQLTVTGNIVQNNNASVGAGMFIDNVNGDVTITANDIRNNQIDPNAPDYEAGGIHVWGIGGQIEVANNIFVDNDNRALKAANFSHILVVNNSVVGTFGDGIDVFSWPSAPPEPSVAQVMNNIIVGQTGCGVTTFNGITLYVDYNLFYNNDTDICGDTTVPPHANIFADPLFEDAAGGNYRLQSGSPAVDSGTGGPGVPGVDIEGTSRPQGSGVDMGAYEAVSYQVFLPVVIKPVEIINVASVRLKSMVNQHSNWERPFTKTSSAHDRGVGK